MAQQARVLAYNDVFLLIAIAAAIGCLWTTFVHFRHQLLTGRTAPPVDEAAAAAD